MALGDGVRSARHLAGASGGDSVTPVDASLVERLALGPLERAAVAEAAATEVPLSHPLEETEWFLTGTDKVHVSVGCLGLRALRTRHTGLPAYELQAPTPVLELLATLVRHPTGRQMLRRQEAARDMTLTGSALMGVRADLDRACRLCTVPLAVAALLARGCADEGGPVLWASFDLASPNVRAAGAGGAAGDSDWVRELREYRRAQQVLIAGVGGLAVHGNDGRPFLTGAVPAEVGRLLRLLVDVALRPHHRDAASPRGEVLDTFWQLRPRGAAVEESEEAFLAALAVHHPRPD